MSMLCAKCGRAIDVGIGIPSHVICEHCETEAITRVEVKAKPVEAILLEMHDDALNALNRYSKCLASYDRQKMFEVNKAIHLLWDVQ